MEIYMLIVVILLTIIAIFIAWRCLSNIKLARSIMKPIKYIEYDAEKIKTTFENLIEEEFEIYSKLNPTLFAPGEAYMNSDDITTTTNIVTSRVFIRITPALKNNLSFIYNFEKDEDIINIIGEKVGLLVVGLAATVNSSMEEDFKDVEKK